jgi:protein N-lysine methyltransferase METTL21A
MRKNVEINHLESRVTVAELNWSVSPYVGSQLVYSLFRGTDLPPDIPRPDVILAADCVYFEPGFPLLAKTLADLADQSTEVLFCYKKRRKVLGNFGLRDTAL